MIRVEIRPELLSWARERAGYDPDALAHRFPKLAAWERGAAKPTLKTDRKVRQRYLEQSCANLDREIDHLVYQVYELTIANRCSFL